MEKRENKRREQEKREAKKKMKMKKAPGGLSIRLLEMRSSRTKWTKLD